MAKGRLPHRQMVTATATARKLATTEKEGFLIEIMVLTEVSWNYRIALMVQPVSIGSYFVADFLKCREIPVQRIFSYLVVENGFYGVLRRTLILARYRAGRIPRFEIRRRR